MATTNDVDTKSAVRKFLEGRAVVDKEDKTADSADEIQTVLESVALSFLLYPQAALAFILRAKNVLQQIVATDLEILSYILKAISEIENPDEPITDTSDLVEAQTALVEVDRLGRVSSDVRAYDRYTQAINRFLDKQLAKYLKRHRRGEFERTGTEAKQDLFRVLSVFSPTHETMMERIGFLLDGVSDFQSVPLTRIVSTRTLTRVRSSLNKVIQAVNKDQLSKTATAIELLAGASALTSISNSRQVYDPTVDTGSYPTNRTISISSEVVAARAVGTGTAIDLGAIATPWVFNVTIDPEISGGNSFAVTLPVAGGSGRHYVAAKTGSPTYAISGSNKFLYVQFDGITPDYPDAAVIRAVELPTGGSVTVAAILTALNHVTTGLINGTAVQLGTTGRIIIYGSSFVTGITVLDSVPGTFDTPGNYTPAAESVHSVLGFRDDQESADPDVFTPEQFVDLVSTRVDGATLSVAEDGTINIVSNSTELLTSLEFTGSIATAFGFDITKTYLAEPGYVELIEDGQVLDPTSLGIYIGSVVSASDVVALSSRNLLAEVANIDGTKLFFDSSIDLPRCTLGLVRILSPLVYAVQTLLSAVRPFRDVFSVDSRELQRVLSPILSKPTLAQISDAQRSIEAIQSKVSNLLEALEETVVRSDRSQFESVALQVMATLEERGLDRSLELLQSCQFSTFFSLTNEEASKGTRFLKASEEVGRNDLAQTTAEQDQDDLDPKGTTSDDNLLPGEELMEDEEQV